MWNKFKESLDTGFKLPLAYDHVDGKPSATLFFAYMSFLLAVFAVIYFIFKGDPLAATASAICLWTIAMVFYRMRMISKFKVDLDDKEIDLESEEEKK